MFYGAKNGSLKIDNANMHYISYGTGKRVLIILPGLGDGLRMVKGAAVPFSYEYRIFAKDYKVYVFSRREPLQENCTIEGMADDIKYAMDRLNIGQADFFGVSMGGMIAQQFALRYPERLGKLVLAVTAPSCGSTLLSILLRWEEMAKQGDYRSLMIDTAEMMYQKNYLRVLRMLYPFLALVKPKSFERYLRMSRAIRNFAPDMPIENIQAPTLVLGGEDDKVAGVEGSRELFSRIPNCTCYIYQGYGHGVYAEARDFNSHVMDFLRR